MSAEPTLRELEAEFLQVGPAGSAHHDSAMPLAEAQGIQFMCPKCYVANGGPVGTHWVRCWFADRGVPAELTPGPGRWRPAGTGLEDLTFVGPDAASVSLAGGSGCQWHGFIREGRATLG